MDLSALSMWGQLLIFFVVLDFVQWFTHILLHKFDFLWKFHKVHHSVKEMGFAAHLRYHWMENILYKPLKTFGVMILGGFEPEQAFIVHFMAIAIGHLNHANVKITWGPLKYIFNNPVMHLYHHVKALPEDRRKGINFGISLSLWDYIFKTNYIPEDSGTIELGFPEDELFPKGFFGQIVYGFGKSKK
jgi:sterol desaturase/sphingolipid hydroxylase (fatty acid hydroxylase superfamily)